MMMLRDLVVENSLIFLGITVLLTILMFAADRKVGDMIRLQRWRAAKAFWLSSCVIGLLMTMVCAVTAIITPSILLFIPAALSAIMVLTFISEPPRSRSVSDDEDPPPFL